MELIIKINGTESNEIMVEDWLSLTNYEVQAILVEAVRPRTKELYSNELVLFLGKEIPQHRQLLDLVLCPTDEVSQ